MIVLASSPMSTSPESPNNNNNCNGSSSYENPNSPINAFSPRNDQSTPASPNSKSNGSGSHSRNPSSNGQGTHPHEMGDVTPEEIEANIAPESTIPADEPLPENIFAPPANNTLRMKVAPSPAASKNKTANPESEPTRQQLETLPSGSITSPRANHVRKATLGSTPLPNEEQSPSKQAEGSPEPVSELSKSATHDGEHDNGEHVDLETSDSECGSHVYTDDEYELGSPGREVTVPELRIEGEQPGEVASPILTHSGGSPPRAPFSDPITPKRM